jgi:1D-myo-inositol-tetrakisphosphate 5-kinase/inositol-polyphosphate multikinase
VYDKDYGRLTVNRDNIVTEMKRFIFNPAAGIDEDLGKIIAGAFLEDLKRVERVLASEESRMYSASLLFTFEGDGEALRAAIEQTMPSTTSSQGDKEKNGQTAAASKPKGADIPGLSTSRVDSAIVLDDDGEMVFRPGENEARKVDTHAGNGKTVLSPVDEVTSALENGAAVHFNTELVVDEEMEDDDEMSNFPRIYSLKLIDFAHASWVPGQGPDENNLFGVRSLIKIFEEMSE